MSARAAIAALAAVIASVGDLSMLWVVSAPNPAFGLPQHVPSVLGIGAALGVLAIPFYALGYRAVATRVAPTAPRAARLIAGCGTAGAVLGALIHGLTARFIETAVAKGVAGGDPLEAVARSGALLPTLWAVAAVAILLASGAFVSSVVRGGTGLPRWLAWMNPALVTLVLAFAGLASPLLRSYLTPAAPNLGHVAFFAACAGVGRRSPADV